MKYIFLILTTVFILSMSVMAQDEPSSTASIKAHTSTDATTTKKLPVATSTEKISTSSFSGESSFDNTTAAKDPVKATTSTKDMPSANGDHEWQFAFAPYLYATGLSGKVGARGRVINIDASFGNVLSHLDMGLMGSFEARHKRFVSVTDFVWTKLSATRDTPGGLFSTAKVGANLFIFDPEAGFQLLGSKAGSLDVLGGARIWSVENTLKTTSGTLAGFDVAQRKTFAAPVVGVHGLMNLSRKFYVSGKFDIGGAGIGADLTTQVYAGVGYRLARHGTLIGGYRYLQVRYDDSQGFLFDTHMNGFVMGVKFNF